MKQLTRRVALTLGLLFLLAGNLEAANRFWVGGNDNWDATAGTKWALTTGGAGGQAVPLATDDVFLDNGTGNGNVTISAASVAKSLTCTGYIRTLTFNATLTVSGNVTFVSGMTIAGTSDLILDATGTLTAGGKTLTGGLQLGSTFKTWTLADAWVVTGVCLNNGTGQVINGGTLRCNGGLTMTGTFGGSSTTVLTLGGGTWSGTGVNNTPLTLAGNVTISGSVSMGAAAFTYSSGTITTTGSTVTTNTTTTWNVAAVTFNNITFSGNSGTTLSAALNMTGTLAISASVTFSGAFNITAAAATFTSTPTATLSGNVSIAGLTQNAGATTINGAFNWNTCGLTTNAALGGTATIVFTCDGAWTGAAGALSNNTTFNNPGGTTTLSGTIKYATGTLTYTAGTIAAGVSILSIASGTLTTSGMTWANVTPTGTALTLGSALNVSGTLTLPDSAFTFSGAFNITTGTLTNTSITATRIVTFVAGTTVAVNTALTTVHAAAQTVRFTWKTSSAGVTTNFVLGSSATQAVGFLDPTDLDASTGAAIFSYAGSASNSNNFKTTIAAFKNAVSRGFIIGGGE